MPRLFVAVALPEDVKDTLLDFVDPSFPGARWLGYDQYHLTLRFIGEVHDGIARDVDDALLGIAAAPFSLSLKGAGYFGDRRRVRVLWAGVSDAAGPNALNRKIERVLQEIGLQPERRRYRPHVTLARCRGTGREDAEAFHNRHADFASRVFDVEGFHLFSSHLGREGAIYRIEADYSLQAAERSRAASAPNA